MLIKNSQKIKVAGWIVLLLLATQLKAATIKGRILDAKTQEPLTGAIFFDKDNTSLDDEAKLDGTFSLRKVMPGKHTFVVRYMGYTPQEKVIDVSAEKENIVINCAMDPENMALNQIEVVGVNDNESTQHALNTELKADKVLNVVSAKSIQLSPDLTVANVLQRVSGVTVQKTANSGEGQYAIIRGMDKRYNYTLVNGIKIPSPNDKNRYVPMDIFPAELLSNVEVIKALTPDLEGDAIGGVMNLNLKNAPDKLLISVNGALGYNKLFFDRPFYQFNSKVVNLKSPSERGINDATPEDFPLENIKFNAIKRLGNINGGISIGNRFFDNKLGIILSVSNQNSYSGADAFVTIPRAQPNPGTLPAFESKISRTYSTQQNRLGVHNKIDYQINKNNSISLYNAYFELDKYISRHDVQTALSTGVGNTEISDRSQYQIEKIYNSTLQGKHALTSHLKADWSAVVSKAWAFNPDESDIKNASTDFGNTLTLQEISHKWKNNSDGDLAGYGNIVWNPELSIPNFEIKGGGMYRHKTRNSYYNIYSLVPIRGAGNTSTVTFSNIEFPSGVGAGSQTNQNDYDVTEDVTAYYGQVKFKLIDKLNVLAGARIEQYQMSWVTPMPISFTGAKGAKSYQDLLPSVHLKYELTPTQNLRLSYFSSISRPGFFEVIPYQIKGETFDEKGNPYLKRAQAQNIDFRYELFPKVSEQILVGAFYKNIADPIEYTLVREEGPSALQLKPQNFGTATNYGLEVVAIKYFGNFGVSANYTYTASSITTYKKTYGRANPLDPSSEFVTDSVLRTRPMQGQTDHIGNLSLLYKNQKVGIDCQLSIVYTGQTIAQVSGWDGLDYWSMPLTTVDFSFEQKLSKKMNISIFGKARNLLNESAIIRILKPNDYYVPSNIQLPNQDSPNSIVVSKEQYGQNFQLGFRYSY